MCGAGEAVHVTMRGYVSPPPEVPAIDHLLVQVEKAAAEAATRDATVAAQLEALVASTRDGLDNIAKTLDKPVRPVFDAQGKLLEARRVNKEA